MGKGKLRHNPDKPQNNYGGDYCCDAFDTYQDGREFCHYVGHESNWDEYVKWMQHDKDDTSKLKCKGNRHTCNKMRLHWIASLSEKEREKYKESFDNTSNKRYN